MPARYRIFVVEDHPLMREGYAGLIRRQPDMEMCGEAATALEALEHAPPLKPDVVVVDVSLGGGFNGIELTKRLRGLLPEAKVLVVSAHDESLYAERALRSGAQGFVMKTQPVTEVIEAIRQVAGGRIYLSGPMHDRFLRQYLSRPGEEKESPLACLTDREMETFELIGRGLSTKEVAEAMVVSPKTVETYRANIKEKLGLSTSTELTHAAATWFAAAEDR